MMNTLNSGKGFLQSDHPITEAGLFETHINVDFPPFGINMGTNRLGPVSETTRISELKQMVISDSNASEAFSQMNLDFGQSLPPPSEPHSQQQGHTSNLTPLSTANMQAILQAILQFIKVQLVHLYEVNEQCEQN